MRASPALCLFATIVLALPVQAQEGMTFAPIVGVSLTDKVWIRADRPDMPGTMQLFLSDGTLISNSCWETYRLSNWRLIDDEHITWQEDGIDIAATIVSLDEAQLTLELDLPGSPEIQTFEVAPVPFICPDMPR